MIEPGDLNALQAMMPDKWMIKKIASGDPKAYWIAANPRTLEGRVFAKEDHDKALDYVNEKNKYEADQAAKARGILERHERDNRKGQDG